MQKRRGWGGGGAGGTCPLASEGRKISEIGDTFGTLYLFMILLSFILPFTGYGRVIIIVAIPMYTSFKRFMYQISYVQYAQLKISTKTLLYLGLQKRYLPHDQLWWAPLKILPKVPLFDENGPLGNRFPHSDEIDETFLEVNETGKVIEEQVWT